MLLALDELAAHLFINVNKAQLVSRKRHRRGSGHGWSLLVCFFSMLHMETHFRYLILAGLCSYPEAGSAEVITRPLQVTFDLLLNIDPPFSLGFSLLAFPSPLITLIACKINYQSCHISHC